MSGRMREREWAEKKEKRGEIHQNVDMFVVSRVQNRIIEEQ